MPQFAHGLVAIGAAVGAADAPRSPALCRCWPGTLLLLAYLPDVLDWLLHLAQAGVPHSAMCSIPATTALSALCMAVLAFVFAERRAIVYVVALAVLWSHLVLDLTSGGIPLWWPLSSEFVGSDPFGVNDLSFRPRVPYEFALYGPLATAGALVAIARRPGRPLPMLLTGGAFGLSVCGALSGSFVLAAVSAIGLALLWLQSRKWTFTLPSAWNLVPAAPVLLLAAVQIHGWSSVELGLRAERRGDPEAAIAHYRRAVFLRPLGLDGIELYRVGRVYIRMGRHDEAAALFEEGLRRDSDRLLFLDAKVHLHLSADDPRYYNPREALRLARIVHERATKAYYKRYASDLVEMAERAVRSNAE